MTNIQTKLENAHDNYQKELTEIASDYREKTLIPLCKKYGLTFTSYDDPGETNYWFIHPDYDGIIRNYHCSGLDGMKMKEFFDKMPGQFLKELKEVFDTLDLIIDEPLEDGYNRYFGNIIENIG